VKLFGGPVGISEGGAHAQT